MLHEDLTRQIIRCFYDVYNELGHGFLEKVYQNSMFLELQDKGFKVIPKLRIPVSFKTKEVGEYYPDLIVNDTVIIELKAEAALAEAHDRQLQNYLRATEIEVGLLFNFGTEPQFKRRIFTNDKKNLKNNHKPPTEI